MGTLEKPCVCSPPLPPLPLHVIAHVLGEPMEGIGNGGSACVCVGGHRCKVHPSLLLPLPSQLTLDGWASGNGGGRDDKWWFLCCAWPLLPPLISYLLAFVVILTNNPVR